MKIENIIILGDIAALCKQIQRNIDLLTEIDEESLESMKQLVGKLDATAINLYPSAEPRSHWFENEP